MPKTIIFWPILLVGICVFFFSYMKMKERIPFKIRSKAERILTLILILILLIDIGFAMYSRMETTKEFNDCIGFYRYFPDFEHPEEDFNFYFLEKCNKYLSEDEIEDLRKSGRAWKANQLSQQSYIPGEKQELNFTLYPTD